MSYDEYKLISDSGLCTAGQGSRPFVRYFHPYRETPGSLSADWIILRSELYVDSFRSFPSFELNRREKGEQVVRERDGGGARTTFVLILTNRCENLCAMFCDVAATQESRSEIWARLLVREADFHKSLENEIFKTLATGSVCHETRRTPEILILKKKKNYTKIYPSISKFLMEFSNRCYVLHTQLLRNCLNLMRH